MNNQKGLKMVTDSPKKNSLNGLIRNSPGAMKLL